ncbi:hypothetical protein DFH27DRAFT_655600 [Peziza echinospora]|nr:hypothetical protein DFH27DRAFT_655600 [Peziza echinospora]
MPIAPEITPITAYFRNFEDSFTYTPPPQNMSRARVVNYLCTQFANLAQAKSWKPHKNINRIEYQKLISATENELGRPNAQHIPSFTGSSSNFLINGIIARVEGLNLNDAPVNGGSEVMGASPSPFKQFFLRYDTPNQRYHWTPESLRNTPEQELERLAGCKWGGPTGAKYRGAKEMFELVKQMDELRGLGEAKVWDDDENCETVAVDNQSGDGTIQEGVSLNNTLPSYPESDQDSSAPRTPSSPEILRESPLRNFFLKYPTKKYTYNPSNKSLDEYKILCRAHNWPIKAKKQKKNPQVREIREEFLRAVETELEILMRGNRDENGAVMTPWAYLMKLFQLDDGVELGSVSKTKGKKITARLYVNIFDLLDYKRGTTGIPTRFKTVGELASYSYRKGRVYPLEAAKKRGILRLLLRGISAAI